MKTTELLRQRLRTLGKTQKYMAERCGMTAVEIGFYINGKRRPNLKAIDKLARGFGLSPRRILDAALTDLRNNSGQTPTDSV